MDDYSIHTC